MKKAIANRNRIADCLSQAADAAKDAELRRRLRALEREVMQDQTVVADERTDGELLELAQSVVGYARDGQQTVADNALARIRELMSRRGRAVEGRSGKMGLLGKIKQTFGRPKEKPEDVARNAADATLFKLEQEIELISQKRSAEVEKLRGVIQEAAGYKQDSYEYRHARAKAGGIKQQIRLYEGQIDAHFQALMNNQRYLQLIDNGLAMKNLSALVPDPAEADAILEKLTVHVEEWQDKQESFTDVIASYGNRVGNASGMLDAADDEFDLAVSELRADAQAKQSEPARVKEAPARPMAAEARAAAPEAMPVERGMETEDSVEEEPEHVDP